MKDTITIQSSGKSIDIPVHHHHTIVIGSGAAGLNTAVQLHAQGIEDIVIITEGLNKGTSINTGSDKQTYYKLGMYGKDADSPESMAKSLFDGGSAHGDIALIEASLSARGFLNLVNLGVPFPQDRFGQFVGYKTDHDPARRATSVGPYTSKKMCEALIAEVERRGIRVLERRDAVSLLTCDERAIGVVVMNKTDLNADPMNSMEVFVAENVVFAVGGPGGLYKTSVYPNVHTGAIGLALLAGAKARNLPESQYGMASTKFRWNVSGTYMQVIPRFISTAADGVSDEQEFLRPWFENTGEMNTAIFLKGYQWPFDPRKVVGGSSIVDILVYIETVQKGRRVFLDFRSNSEEFSFDALSDEAREYLENSEALLETPIKRLEKMNAPAISLYADHNIDIVKEPLEIAVCAQHNNGGLAGTIWWESENIKHLFPVGEVNGSHGVYRPGGSALNAGQVAGFRAAEYIANKYKTRTVDMKSAMSAAEKSCQELSDWLESGKNSEHDWKNDREELQTRMSRHGAHIRSSETISQAVDEASNQWKNMSSQSSSWSDLKSACEALRNRHLCFAHLAYLQAVKFALDSDLGSRGSAIVLSSDGAPAHPQLDETWKFAQENEEYRDKVLETLPNDGDFSSKWTARRPLPINDAWFETTWAAYRNGEIYD